MWNVLRRVICIMPGEILLFQTLSSADNIHVHHSAPDLRPGSILIKSITRWNWQMLNIGRRYLTVLPAEFRYPQVKVETIPILNSANISNYSNVNVKSIIPLYSHHTRVILELAFIKTVDSPWRFKQTSINVRLSEFVMRSRSPSSSWRVSHLPHWPAPSAGKPQTKLYLGKIMQLSTQLSVFRNVLTDFHRTWERFSSESWVRFSNGYKIRYCRGLGIKIAEID